MKVNIVGNGEWGNALYSVIKQNCETVSIIDRNEKCSDCDVLILSVPTQSIREALKEISLTRKNIIVINTAKGIEKSSYLLPYQIIKECLGIEIDYYTLVGPSFANEVKEKMPTLVNIGCDNKNENNIVVKDLFQTDYFRVRLSTSVEALELSAAFKNVYAIACGLAQALGYEINTRVKLMVLAIEELRELSKKMGFYIDLDATAGTIGDLILTCNSIESRNFKFGSLLAKYSVSEAINKINSTVEGFHSLASIEYFKNKTNVKLPLASFVSNVIKIDDPKKLKKEFEKFVSLT